MWPATPRLLSKECWRLCRSGELVKILVIGSGIGGLTAALEAAEFADVTLITKSQLANSNTWYAQGGMAAVTTQSDTVASHVSDTITAGAGLTDAHAAEVLCSSGRKIVTDLANRGVVFDSGVGLEAAHSHPRILHAGGDATGAGIADALIAQVRSSAIEVREETTVVELDGTSVILLDGARIAADAVVLATGGAGQLYPFTTNPPVATGDGFAMAMLAGAVVTDVEFYQFHPTVFEGSYLISEAVRGEGAHLIDAEGKRFMLDVHPLAELAPRDVVARAIFEREAYLDATMLGAEFLATRFPTLDRGLRERSIDWSTTPVPVTPAAHYWMGGVRTDEWGRTSLPGIYAVGEVACTGVHGANRLASNSLLEAAVFATRAISALKEDQTSGEQPPHWDSVALPAHSGGDSLIRTDLQAIMFADAGLVRDETGLARGWEAINRFSMPEPQDVKSLEDRNLLIAARAVMHAARNRKESRGSHFRRDYPGQAAPQRFNWTLR